MKKYFQGLIDFKKGGFSYSCIFLKSNEQRSETVSKNKRYIPAMIIQILKRLWNDEMFGEVSYPKNMICFRIRILFKVTS